MHWKSTLSREDDLERAVAECSAPLLEDPCPELVVVFVSSAFRPDFHLLGGLLCRRFPEARVVGCSADGVIGNAQEAEFVPALSLTAGWLPGVQVMTFQLSDQDLPDMDAPPEAWREKVAAGRPDVAGLLLLADPFTFDGQALLTGLDYAYPKAVKVGGLASGGQVPGQNALFVDRVVFDSGVVGVSFMGDIAVESVVAQGCRPIGSPMVVTECDRNFLKELDNEPALEKVSQTVRALSPRDRKLASHSLFLGVGMGGARLEYGPGDFLVRNLVGFEPESQSLVVGAFLRKGQVVQLHLRDARTSAEDLELMLTRYRDAEGFRQPRGALLFSCLGRGQSLYGQPDHDTGLFEKLVGKIPLGGFFCNGEIGPVGGTTSIHGYTSCFALFSEPA